MVVKENGNQLILIPDAFEAIFARLIIVAPFSLVAIWIVVATASRSIQNDRVCIISSRAGLIRLQPNHDEVVTGNQSREGS